MDKGNIAMFTLPPLPYDMNALAPAVSAETLEYHYGKHHKAYVDNLNKLTDGTPQAKSSLEDLVRAAQGPVFNNAAQAWNHAFYWSCLKPKAGGEPTGRLAEAINKDFGSFAKFKEEFTAKAVGQFGSGWAWLVLKGGKLSVESTSNAGNPMTTGGAPLLVCDVWEHAYYIDYRNARAKYVEAFWGLVDWSFAEANFEKAALTKTSK